MNILHQREEQVPLAPALAGLPTSVTDSDAALLQKTDELAQQFLSKQRILIISQIEKQIDTQFSIQILLQAARKFFKSQLAASHSLSLSIVEILNDEAADLLLPESYRQQYLSKPFQKILLRSYQQIKQIFELLPLNAKFHKYLELTISAPVESDVNFGVLIVNPQLCDKFLHKLVNVFQNLKSQRHSLDLQSHRLLKHLKYFFSSGTFLTNILFSSGEPPQFQTAIFRLFAVKAFPRVESNIDYYKSDTRGFTKDERERKSQFLALQVGNKKLCKLMAEMQQQCVELQNYDFQSLLAQYNLTDDFVDQVVTLANQGLTQEELNDALPHAENFTRYNVQVPPAGAYQEIVELKVEDEVFPQEAIDSEVESTSIVIPEVQKPVGPISQADFDALCTKYEAPVLQLQAEIQAKQFNVFEIIKGKLKKVDVKVQIKGQKLTFEKLQRLQSIQENIDSHEEQFKLFLYSSYNFLVQIGGAPEQTVFAIRLNQRKDHEIKPKLLEQLQLKPDDLVSINNQQLYSQDSYWLAECWTRWQF